MFVAIILLLLLAFYFLLRISSATADFVELQESFLNAENFSGTGFHEIKIHDDSMNTGDDSGIMKAEKQHFVCQVASFGRPESIMLYCCMLSVLLLGYAAIRLAKKLLVRYARIHFGNAPLSNSCIDLAISLVSIVCLYYLTRFLGGFVNGIQFKTQIQNEENVCKDIEAAYWREILVIVSSLTIGILVLSVLVACFARLLPTDDRDLNNNL